MKKLITLMICLSPGLVISCSGKMESIKTSLGDLVKIEKSRQVTTDDQSAGTIKPKSGQSLLVLTFEGKSEIPYETGSEDYYPLVDSAGRKYPPIYAGSPTAEGRLSGKDWTLNGQSTGKDGRFVFAGTATLREPKVVFVYETPENATGLALKDGDRKHPIAP